MINNALQLMILQQLTCSNNSKYIDKDIPTRSMFIKHFSTIYDITNELPYMLVPTVSKSDIISFTVDYDGTLIISTKDAIMYYILENKYNKEIGSIGPYFILIYSDANFKNVKFSQSGTFKYDGKWYYSTYKYLIKTSDGYEVIDNADDVDDSDIESSIFMNIYKESLTLDDNEQLLYKRDGVTITNGNGKTHINVEGYGEYTINAYDENSIIDVTTTDGDVICISIGMEIYVVSLYVIYNSTSTWQFVNPIERIVMETENGKIKKFNSTILTVSTTTRGFLDGILVRNSIFVGTGNTIWKLSFDRSVKSEIGEKLD